MDFSIIAAMDQARGIGKNNDLPWHLSEDLKHFAKTTTGGTVIMGRRTWESIPDKYRPFKNRLNIVLSSQKLDLPEGVLLANSLDQALELAQNQAFVIGGATLFKEAIQHSNCKKLILSHINHTFDCDAFFPEIPTQFQKQSESKTIHDSTDFKISIYGS